MSRKMTQSHIGILILLVMSGIASSAPADAIRYDVTNLGVVPPSDGDYRDGVAPHFDRSGAIMFGYPAVSTYQGPLPAGLDVSSKLPFSYPTTLSVTSEAGAYSAGNVLGPINQYGFNAFVSDGATARLLPTSLAYGVVGINDKGQLIAKAGLNDQLYDFKDGSTRTLLGLNGFSNNLSQALGLNDLGQVVGRSSFDLNAPFGPMHAWIATTPGIGLPTDLNSLIDPKSGWLLNSASGISDDGRIVGVGRSADGELSYYLLTPRPVPEPTTLATLGLSMIAVIAFRRHRLRRSIQEAGANQMRGHGRM